MPQYQVLRKVSFVNLDTLEERPTLFNPEQFSQSINVDWKSFQVVGLGYEPVMYSHTGNHEFSLTLPWRVTTVAERYRFREFVRFIKSCCYPEQPGASPPDVLFVWPGVVSVPVKIRTYSQTDILFNKQAEATRTDIALTMFWVRRQALLAGEMRQYGASEGVD